MELSLIIGLIVNQEFLRKAKKRSYYGRRFRQLLSDWGYESVHFLGARNLKFSIIDAYLSRELL